MSSPNDATQSASSSALTVAGIILAAGASRRMGGRPKALLRIDEEFLVLRIARQLREAGFAPVLVVTGAHTEKIRTAIDGDDGGIEWLHNPQWHEGMASSIRAGINALMRFSPGAALITPVDLPRARTEDWRKLRSRFAETRAVTAAAQGLKRGPGAPAIFPAQFFFQLSDLHGDRGARDWLRARVSEVSLVEAPNLTADADSPEAARRLLGPDAPP